MGDLSLECGGTLSENSYKPSRDLSEAKLQPYRFTGYQDKDTKTDILLLL